MVSNTPKIIALSAVLKIYVSKNASTFSNTRLLNNFTIKNNIANVNSTLNIMYNVVLSKLKLCICLDPHLTAALIGLWNISSELIVPNNKTPNQLAVFSNIPKKYSIGNKTKTANKLKKSCIVAAWNARLNSFPLCMCPIETNVLVTVVPIFAPIIIGTAPDNVTVPDPTIATINEEVVEELWNNVVAKIPIKRATNGFPVVDITCCAKSPPNNLIPLESPLIPTKNKYKAKKTPAIFNTILKFSFMNLYWYFSYNKFKTTINYLILKFKLKI